MRAGPAHLLPMNRHDTHGPVMADHCKPLAQSRTLAPIHYGISGMDNYAEVDDPLGRLRKAAGDCAVAVQVVEPGAWLTWPA